MAKRRLFLALPVEEASARRWAVAFAEAVERCAGPHRARRLRSVRPAEWHLTLCFLGMTPEEAVEPLVREAGPRFARCAPPAVDELVGGAFPERGRARVLWWGPREAPGAEGRLAAVADAAREAVEAALPGSLPAKDRFHPHLTGARVPRGERGPSREALDAFRDERLACDWRPKEAVLFESRAGADGPRYAALARFPLADRDEGISTPEG